MGNDGKKYPWAQTKAWRNNQHNITGWGMAYEIPLGVEITEWNWPEYSIHILSTAP
jgi:hypothetical protein